VIFDNLIATGGAVRLTNMSSVGGWWITRQSLEPGEEKLAGYPANYLRGDERPWGGKLYLTTHRLIFLPSFIDRFMGSESVIFELAEVTVADRETTASIQSAKDQIRVVLDSGEDEFFVVQHPDATVDAINDAIGQVPPPSVTESEAVEE